MPNSEPTPEELLAAARLQPASRAALDALNDHGVRFLECGRLKEALELLQASQVLQPHSALAAINLGIALCRCGRYAEAAQILRGPFDDNRYRAEADFNLGIALEGLGATLQAVAAYREVVARCPDHVNGLNNLGNALESLGEFREALGAYEAALAVAPGSVAVLNNLGCLERKLGRIDEAAAHLGRAIELDPTRAVLWNNLANVQKDAGDLDTAVEAFRRARARAPDDPVTHGNLAYALSFQSADPLEILAECQRWSERFARPLASLIEAHRNERSGSRRLRIGYVSPDFRDHCQSLFMLPVLTHHNHLDFEIYGYSSVRRPDTVTQRIAGLVDVWREVRTLDDAELAMRIREDSIDILVDLSMHMADGRPLLFARKPAPIQVAWLAYPGTTGLDAIDYRLTDPRLDPAESEAHYSERSAWLPDAFWVYDPLTAEPPVNPLPAQARGYVTFGCLNNPCKVTGATLALWSAVLRAVPGSRLLLLAPAGSARDRLQARLEALGVERGRVSFVAFRPRAEYLAAYHEVDIGLDTVPYNGHTTSLDAFWMGVPVISRLGSTCVGRGGSSQLFQLGLTELLAATDAGFVETAVRLAADLPRLAELRAGLRSRLATSPLMDAARFTRHLEQFYRRAWQDYCRVA